MFQTQNKEAVNQSKRINKYFPLKKQTQNLYHQMRRLKKLEKFLLFYLNPHKEYLRAREY